MMTIGKRIKERRIALGLSVDQLADALGKNRATIYRYESNDIENLPTSVLEPLARALHTTPAYLMGWEDEDQKKVSEPLPANMMPYKPTRRAPVLGRVAAGLPMFAEENIEGYVPIDYDDDEIYYALTVRGDSMNAVGIDDGDLVVVRKQSVVDPDQIAVVLVNGDDATIKYFRQEGDLVILTPKSLNPVHQIQIYNLKDVPVRIIGRVVSAHKKY